MNDQITLSREQLAKFMSLCGQTIVSVMTNKPLSKESLENSFKTHMQPDYIENTIAGIAIDFDNYQNDSGGDYDINEFRELLNED